MKHVKTLMAAAVFAAVAAEAENIYWNSSVSYGWNDSRQWKEGKVPTENDQAYLYNNAHVVITDSEWDNFSKAGGVLINNTGSLTFDLSGDKTYKGMLSGTDKARIVKCGEGTLAISPEKNNAYILYSGWLVVSNGSLRVDKVYHYEGAWPGVDICRNARFIYGSAYETSSYFRGIRGEGVFENDAGGQIIVRGKYDASGKVPECVFSGTFEGESVELSMGVSSMDAEGGAPCRQVFANEVNENKTTVRLYCNCISSNTLNHKNKYQHK